MFNWIKNKSKKGLCLVAHPDDCVIFAQAFMQEQKNIEWTIVYLTQLAATSRGAEISSYWQNKKIATKFLGFQDKIPLSNQNDEVAILNRLIENIVEFDLVLTHNPVGEYGHVHHVLLNSVAQKLPQPKVYFGYGFFHNHVSPTPKDQLPALPLHEQEIEKFDSVLRCQYYVDDKAKEIL